MTVENMNKTLTADEALELAYTMLVEIANGRTYPSHAYWQNLSNIGTAAKPLIARREAAELVKAMAEQCVEVWDSDCSQEPIFNGASIAFSDDEVMLSTLLHRIARYL